MPMQTPGAAGRSSLFERLGRVISHSPVARGWRRSSDLGLGQRSLGFAALGFLTLVPLLIIVSSADPKHGRGFAQWLGEGLGVSTTSREHVEQLFIRPGQALRTTTAFGLAVLAAFGLAFGAAVQSGYEKVWDLPPARWWAR
jgi:membrane protein